MRNLLLLAMVAAWLIPSAPAWGVPLESEDVRKALDEAPLTLVERGLAEDRLARELRATDPLFDEGFGLVRMNLSDDQVAVFDTLTGPLTRLALVRMDPDGRAELMATLAERLLLDEDQTLALVPVLRNTATEASRCVRAGWAGDPMPLGLGPRIDRCLTRTDRLLPEGVAVETLHLEIRRAMQADPGGLEPPLPDLHPETWDVFR